MELDAECCTGDNSRDGLSAALPARPSISAPAAVHAPQADSWLLKHGPELPPPPAIVSDVDPLGMELANAPSARLFAEMARIGPRNYLLSRDPVGFFERRMAFRRLFSYAIPTPSAVAGIAAFAGAGGVCEVAAGRGLWARLINEAGSPVEATDCAMTDRGFANEKSGYFDASPHVFFPVRQDIAHNAAACTEKQTLLLVWPPYDTPVAAVALEAFRGNQLVFIGETRGGCTGGDDFFDALDQGWERGGAIAIPRWETSHDAAHFYCRKPTA